MGTEHGDRDREPEALSDAEVAALHEVELGIEHFKRAHGHLVAFHHAIGRGMDHLADAEEDLRDAGHERLADVVRDDFLPRGVIGRAEDDDHGSWSYELVETYEDDFLADLVAFGNEASRRLADGLRHVQERRQQREWRERADRD